MSTGDAQEKSVRSYKLKFAPNLKLTLVDRLFQGFDFVAKIRIQVL
jgi:hypothetical protein